METRPAHELHSTVRRARKARGEIVGLMNKLTYDVRLVENNLARANHLTRHRLSAAMSPFYLPMVDQIVQNLRNISAALFASVSIRHVHTYNQAKDVPSDISNVFYAAQNLSNMIIEEILNGPTVTHSRLSFERWVAVMKRAHETHDYFTANVICLALSSEAMLLSGLSGMLTVTARAVLEYLERQYIHPSFIYSLQAYHAVRGQAVIPMITTLTYLLERLNHLPYQASEARALFRIMKSRVRRTRGEPMRGIMKCIKKEPAVSHQQRFIYYAEGIKNTKTWRLREINITLTSLKLFDETDKFYIAKHTIEMNMTKLKRLEEMNGGLNTVIWNIIHDEHITDADKAKELKRCYRDFHQRMDLALKHIIISVSDAYKVIKHYGEKAACVEPCMLMGEDGGDSLSSSSESELIHKPKKKFSWLHREERALKRAVAAQSIPTNPLTPRKSFGLFRAASQLPLSGQEEIVRKRSVRPRGSLGF